MEFKLHKKLQGLTKDSYDTNYFALNKKGKSKGIWLVDTFCINYVA